MTEQNKIVDRLYDEVFDAFDRVKPLPMKDFAQVGSEASILIQIQALSPLTFSIRIIGQDNKPVYLSGEKANILFCLRGHIRTISEANEKVVSNSNAWIGEHWSIPKKTDGLTQKELDDLLNEAFPILPNGRP